MDSSFTPWPEDVAAGYRRDGLWTGHTFTELLHARAKQHRDHIAVSDADETLSYRELTQRSDNIAAGLYALGVRHGDRVVLQATNTAEYLAVLFGMFRLGAVPVCALPAHRELEIGYFCRHTEAAAYVHPAGSDYESVAASVTRHVPRTMTISQAAQLKGGTVPAQPRSHDLALLQLSGGSTGVPKLIPRTHDDYVYSVRISADICRLDESSVYLCALPIAHNFALSSPGALGVLHAGGGVVLAPEPSPDTVFPLLRDKDVTITATVPAVALAWLRAARNRRPRFPALEVLQVGGARLDARDAAEVAPVFGARLQQVFGMAEGLVCYTRLDDPEHVIAETQGRPASAADEVRVVDDEDNDVPDGTSGHLLTRGPYTVRGYYRAEAHNRTAFSSDGYYRTGDTVRRVPSGHLVVTGRTKEQVNRGGEKIAAPEIEEQLRAHPSIYDAALVSVPDEKLGERGCAVCVRHDEQLTAPELRRFLRERGLAAYKIPDLVRFVDSLPRTAVGKVDKQTLKEYLSS